LDGRGGCPGSARHASADSRSIDEHLLHHERSAELDEADDHQKEHRRDDGEFRGGRSEPATARATRTDSEYL
jgi:hypothetical protein